jgi:hypothetical protein
MTLKEICGSLPMTTPVSPFLLSAAGAIRTLSLLSPTVTFSLQAAIAKTRRRG